MFSARWNNRFWWIVLLCAGGVSVYFSYFTILRHYRFESRDFDLGVISNVILNTAWGDIFRSSYYDGKSFLGVHVVPLYLLLAIPYRLFPYPETLLILQSFAVSCAALPLFLAASKAGLTQGAAFVVAILFLLHPANHGALFYDFHEISFFPIFFFFFSYMWIAGSKRGALVGLLLSLSVKEDVALFVLAALPLLMRWGNTLRPRNVLITCVGWYLCTVYLRYSFGGEAHPFARYYQDLIPQGYSGLSGILWGIVSDPWKVVETRATASRVQYVAELFIGMGFGPLLSWVGMGAVAPGLLLSVLSGDHKSELFRTSFQYVWQVLPGGFLALVYATRRFASYSPELGRAFVACVCLVGVLYSFQHGALLVRREGFIGGYREVSFTLREEHIQQREAFQRLQTGVPEDDWIVCSAGVCSQLWKKRNVIPCRMWYHEKQNFVRWVIGGQDKNCSEKTLRRLGFQVHAQTVAHRLWKRD